MIEQLWSFFVCVYIYIYIYISQIIALMVRKRKQKKPSKWFEDENIQRITVKGKNIYWKKI